jgi:tetratricopeptide (TPR) repeat protein
MPAATAAAEAADAGAAELVEAARSEPLPDQELTPDILYQMLLAEIASQRGETDLAIKAYTELANQTRDPRVARRAAEMALFARRNEAALESARLWVELDPESPQARQMLAGVLVGTDRLDEIEPHIAKLLSQEGARLGDGLQRLNRLFSRHQDKRTVWALVDKLTQPYLTVPEARFARAQAAQAAGDLPKALEEVSVAQSLRPGWEQVALFKAQVLQAESSAKALESLQRFLSDYPRARDVRLHYARGLAGEKKYAEARSEFQRLLKDFPDNPDVILAVAVLSMQLNDQAMAESNFKRLLDLNQGDPNLARVYLGQIAEDRKDMDMALEWYAAVDGGDQFLSAQIRYANVLGRQGKVDEARRHLQDLASKNSRDRMQLLLAEAQVLRDAGRTREAFELLDQQLSGQPEQPELLYETALLAEKLGRVEVLEANLRKLIAIKPDHAHAYNALGYSYADRNERLDEAQQLIAKALQLAPEDPFIIDSMGWVLYRKGDLHGALDQLQRAFGIRKDPEIAAHLGEVLWMLGRKAEASKTWRDASAANPGNEVLVEVMKKFPH